MAWGGKAGDPPPPLPKPNQAVLLEKCLPTQLLCNHEDGELGSSLENPPIMCSLILMWNVRLEKVDSQ